MANKNQKLQNLEKKLGMAKTLVEELGGFDDADDAPKESKKSDHFGDLKKITEATLVPVEETPCELVPISDEPEEMFTLGMLKQDFMLARQNVIKVCNIGQNILAQASLLDLSDMKASQLDALSNLQNTLGNNLKLMITLYKEIIDIEKSKAALKGKYSEAPHTLSQTVVQGDVHQNVIMSGGTHDILAILDERRKKKEAKEAEEAEEAEEVKDGTV